MPVIGWLTTELIRARVSARLASFLAWVIAGIALALLIWAAWSLLKNSIISAHDTEVRAEAAEAQLDRQAEADGDQLNRQAADDAKADYLHGVLTNAVIADPAAGNAAAGPGTNAVLDGLRKRQEGRSQPR